MFKKGLIKDSFTYTVISRRGEGKNCVFLHYQYSFSGDGGTSLESSLFFGSTDVIRGI